MTVAVHTMTESVEVRFCIVRLSIWSENAYAD